MESVDCLLGHKEGSELAFTGTDRLGARRDTFQIMRCSRCGLLFVSPRPSPEEMMQYYPFDEYEPYYRAIDEKPTLERLHRSHIQRQRCRFVERAKRQGRVLDVGCATGNFLAQLQERGRWETFGVEINQAAARYAQERFRLSVFAGQLADAGYPSGHFDLVTMWSVLEHLHNPLESLVEVRRILRPDGVLAFTIPNGDSLDAQLFGPHWGLLDPPRHLYTFTRPALEELLSRTGFRIRAVRSFAAGYLSLWRSIRAWLESQESQSGAAFRHLLCSLIPSKPFRVLSLPYVWSASQLGRGATISVLAEPAR